VSNAKYLTYRGDVKAVAAAGGTLVFVTVHPEGQPTALYRLDPEKLTLAEDRLPAGGQALLVTDGGVWIAATDRCLYHSPAGGGNVEPRGSQLEAAPIALAPLAAGRLAVAAGPRVIVLDRHDGKVLQKLELPETATSLAADPTGQWLAVGTAKGTVCVFECESNPDAFAPSDSAPLHEAAVTALLFEAEDLRFLSAGADQKLLSTHARGRLEAEDRGRGATHEKPITAMIAGPQDRFLTGSADSSLKSWPRGKGARPVTLTEGVGRVVALAVVPVERQSQVVAACDDNTLRFFRLDQEGKFGEAGARIHGALAWAKHELAQDDPRRREAALRVLAGFADAASIKRIASQMTHDADHGLQLLACRLLSESAHPRAGPALEHGLEHGDEAVRLLAFDGLRRRAAPEDLRPLALALKADKADVGVRAIEALEGRAGKDERALARLTGALGSGVPEVRRAALLSLERVRGAGSPDASLAALASAHADLRRFALLRLFQRRLLHDPRVQGALRWRGDDSDSEVRRIAFLLSLCTREKLLRALRERDPELERQLVELESGAEKLYVAPAEDPPTPPAEPAMAEGIESAVMQAMERLKDLRERHPDLIPKLVELWSGAEAPQASPAGEPDMMEVLNALVGQMQALTEGREEEE
jgi:ParB family chromosome partitioning protein